MTDKPQQNIASDPLLVARQVGFVSRGKTILSDVSLQVTQKEIITLIGPNGAGKTSLIRILLGLSKASSGSGKRKTKPTYRLCAATRIRARCDAASCLRFYKCHELV